jgi:hypothetical protein
MIEVDHSLLNPEPTPEPARPILASHLLELEEKQRLRFTGGSVRTEFAGVDELLGGGFERGILVGLSAEGGEGRLVSDFLWFSASSQCLCGKNRKKPKKHHPSKQDNFTF